MTVVLEVRDLQKTFGAVVAAKDINVSVKEHEIVGIIGANGAGKTTLFKMISDTEKCDSGSIRLGDTVRLGYVDQSRAELGDDKTVWEEISEGLDEVELGHRTIKSGLCLAV